MHLTCAEQVSDSFSNTVPPHGDNMFENVAVYDAKAWTTRLLSVKLRSVVSLPHPSEKFIPA